MTSKRLSHYELLGVSRDATSKQIAFAYKKLALALHPDKNPYGAQLMKQVNEAKGVLSDESKRRRYDQELDRSGNDSSSSPTEMSSLQRALRQSEHQREMLRIEVSSLQAQLAVARASATPPRNSHDVNRLRNKLQHSEDRCRRLQSKVNRLKSDNRSLAHDLEAVEQENEHLSDEKQYYEDEASVAKENLQNAVREHERKAKDELATALKAERDRSNIALERMKQEMTERSLCYLCNGEGGSDCPLCRGFGSLPGAWTKCRKCNGAGFITSFCGSRHNNCVTCFSKGARRGSLTFVCFQCKGTGNNCKVCYKGRIRGFNCKACPLCSGNPSPIAGCENCLDKGFVPCQCGYSCSGHGIEGKP